METRNGKLRWQDRPTDIEEEEEEEEEDDDDDDDDDRFPKMQFPFFEALK